MKDIDAEINAKIQSAKNILIVSHVRPDGDAIGALLGLGLALQQVGKTVQMVLNDGLPASFRHLPGSAQIKKEVQGEVDLFITVDCADFKRTGKQFENFRMPDINIDHHVTNEKFGQLNLIEPEAVATSAILTGWLDPTSSWISKRSWIPNSLSRNPARPNACLLPHTTKWSLSDTMALFAKLTPKLWAILLNERSSPPSSEPQLFPAMNNPPPLFTNSLMELTSSWE